jgi:hypothetical protein
MMCLGHSSTFTSTAVLSDHSTFTSTSVLSGRHDRSSLLFLADLLSSRGVCVCNSSSSPPPPQSFHGIRAWHRLKAEQQAEKTKDTV